MSAYRLMANLGEEKGRPSGEKALLELSAGFLSEETIDSSRTDFSGNRQPRV